MEFRLISTSETIKLEFGDYEQKLTYLVDDFKPDQFVAVVRINDTRYVAPNMKSIGIFPTRKEAENACHKDLQERASKSIKE